MRKILIAICMVLGIGQATAADYPTRPIRLIVHFPAGSSTDVIARTFADNISKKLGQQIIIDNKPGADGAIAAFADLGIARKIFLHINNSSTNNFQLPFFF